MPQTAPVPGTTPPSAELVLLGVFVQSYLATHSRRSGLALIKEARRRLHDMDGRELFPTQAEARIWFDAHLPELMNSLP